MADLNVFAHPPPKATGTIDAEAEACHTAWEGVPVGSYGWHIHHEQLVEQTTEPIEHRIRFIIDNKPQHEVALRLRLMRPVKDAAAIASARKAYDAATASARKADAATASARKAYAAAIASARKAYDAAIASAHLIECPNCTWDGKTIFPEALP